MQVALPLVLQSPEGTLAGGTLFSWELLGRAVQTVPRLASQLNGAGSSGWKGHRADTVFSPQLLTLTLMVAWRPRGSWVLVSSISDSKWLWW